MWIWWSPTGDFADGGRLRGTLAGNYTQTEFDRIAGTPAPLAALGITTPLFDLTQQLRFSDSLPGDKIALDLDYARGPFGVSLTNTRYGEVSTLALTNRTPAQIAVTPGYDVRQVPVGAAGNADLIQTFGAEWLTDLEISWEVTPTVRLSLGAQNLFDVYPDENVASSVASVAAGTNGADNVGTQPCNAISPFGFSGRSMFFRVGLTF